MNRWSLVAACVGGALCLACFAPWSRAQEPGDDRKKNDVEPLTKEQLEMRQGNKNFVYTFKVGDQYIAERTMRRRETRTVLDKRSTDTDVATLETVSTVKKTNADGSADFDCFVKHVTFKRVGRSFVTYDSDDPTKSERGDGWELLAGAKFSFKADANGNVSGIAPGPATAAYWKEQPRELRYMFADEALRRLLPFRTLPKDRVRRGTRWESKETLEDFQFGKREMELTTAYTGTETVRGKSYEDMRISGLSKLLDKKPRYEMLSHVIDGKMWFDLGRGELKEWGMYEEYLYNPPGAPLVDSAKEAQKKKGAKKGGGRGGRGGGGSEGGGSAGMAAGGMGFEGGGDDGGSEGGSGGMTGYPGSGGGGSKGGSGGVGGGPGGTPGMKGQKGQKKKGGKSDEDKKKDDEKAAKDKSIEVIIESNVKLTFRGPPLFETP